MPHLIMLLLALLTAAVVVPKHPSPPLGGFSPLESMVAFDLDTVLEQPTVSPAGGIARRSAS